MNKKPSFQEYFSACVYTVIGLLVFVYIITVINLYKSTGEIHFNIFNSPALNKYLVFMAIGIPVAIVLVAACSGNNEEDEN